MKNLAVAIIIVSFLASCAGSYKTVTVRTQRINTSQVLQIPIECDLVVNNTKVSGTFSGVKVSVEHAKNMAINDVLFKHNGDILIEPTYTVVTEGKNVTVDVQGFVGTYKNFQKPVVDTTLYVPVKGKR